MWSWKSSLHFYLIPLNDTLELGRLRGMPFSRLECPPCPLESVPVPSLRVHTFSGGIISGAALVNADSSTIFSHRLILDYVWQASGDRSMSAFPLCHRFLIESMPTSPPPSTLCLRSSKNLQIPEQATPPQLGKRKCSLRVRPDSASASDCCLRLSKCLLTLSPWWQ